ncbi:hypothetical protein V8G54_002011 [Vigna mungo]|uniref:Uncharacterized protein n=1 Tax=Vigna mungo TaxID=3915 RepID=A0AAQ3PAI4_VIGMU
MPQAKSRQKSRRRISESTKDSYSTQDPSIPHYPSRLLSRATRSIPPLTTRNPTPSQPNSRPAGCLCSSRHGGLRSADPRRRGGSQAHVRPPGRSSVAAPTTAPRLSRTSGRGGSHAP